MNNFNTDLMQILAKGLDINEFFRQQLEIAINDLLKSELTVFLDYEKWEYKGYGSGNSRNRSSRKKVGWVFIKMVKKIYKTKKNGIR